MTREEEKNAAVSKYIEYIEDNSMADGYIAISAHKYAFIEGADWADAHPKSSWISVKERLPIEEKDGLSTKVLVLSTKNKVDFSRYDYDVGGWISPVLDIEFTHWSPIPELPKE